LPEDRGVQSRELCFWQAVARYLNAGGSIAALREGLNNPELNQIPEISIPNYYLLGTEQELADEMPTHTFVHNTDGELLILWEEDAYICESTEEEELAYREEMDDENEHDRTTARHQPSARTQGEVDGQPPAPGLPGPTTDG
jgi:hypothetical protein